jgi:peptidoglycan/xylan/chitin deacetylase (PgdA/CDA1 family)
MKYRHDNKRICTTVFIVIIIALAVISITSVSTIITPAQSKMSHHTKSSKSGSFIKGTNSNQSAAAEKVSASIANNNNFLNSNAKNNNSKKVVILSFDDNRIGDFTYAKPILDKYGFKATFFVICGKTTDSGAMNWQDIAAMQKDGMDIESHTMTHAHLNTLNQNQLNYEIGGSKQCLANHGYNTTIFAYPYNEGSNNPVVVNTVAKYYDMARSGTDPLMFLNCEGFVKQPPQTDCRTYTPNGKLTYANRYAIRSLSFDILEIKDSFDNASMFSDFVKTVNSQNSYNQGGKINAVPLITFHNVALTTNKPYYTNAGIFDKFMKYLHDNGFRVLNFKQIGYNMQNNTFYLKDVKG